MTLLARLQTQIIRYWLGFKDIVVAGRAYPFLAGLSFFESFLIAIPVDPFLAAIVIADRTRWVYAACIATVSSTAGALVGYALGYFAFDLIRDWFFAVSESSRLLQRIVELFSENAVALTFAAALTPIPNGPVVIAAGFVGTALIWFLLAWVVARAIRFFGVAYIVYAFGQDTLSQSERFLNIATIVLALVLLGWFMIAASGF
ncbi:hypothetical protein KGO06_02380 [Patescibacteria group bacterium]|nr:hypothetical protein [Patescibacteria group bacterium]